MSLRPWFILFLTPLTVLAQTTVTTPSVALSVNGADAGYANAGGCEDPVAVTYTARSSATPCNDLQFWATTSGTCGNTPGSTDKTLGSIASSSVLTQPTGGINFTVKDLPGFSDAGCGEAVVITYQLCGAFKYPGTNGITTSCSTDAYSTLTNRPTFVYDAVAPSAPTINTVTTLENALTLELDTSEDTESVRVEVRRFENDVGTGDWVSKGKFPLNAPVQVTSLENGVTYELRARALDFAANESDFSASATGTPQQLTGFWDRYQAAGGSGGCAQGGMTPLWFLAVLPALVAMRRRWR